MVTELVLFFFRFVFKLGGVREGRTVALLYYMITSFQGGLAKQSEEFF